MPKKSIDGSARSDDSGAKAASAANSEVRGDSADQLCVEEALKFVLARPMATPREMGAAFDQFIAAAADLAGCTVRSRITPGLSGVTISWDKSTVPSREWLRGLEEEIVAFGACSGLQVWFRRH
jgi:hypothetical protein